MTRKMVVAALVAAAIVVLATDSDALQSVLQGTGTGALIAALSVAIVLTYRSSGVVNVGAGAMAMFAGYTYGLLVHSGQLLLPPFRISLGGPLDTVPALLVTCVLFGIWGAFLHFVIFGRLHAASAIAKLIASAGLLITLQAIIAIMFEAQPLVIPPVLGVESVHLFGGITVNAAPLILAGIVIACGTGLAVVFKFTNLGLTMRAAAESEKAISLRGHSPGRLALLSWIATGSLLGVLGALSASIAGSTDPVTVTVLVIPALAAALLAGFSSFGVAMAGSFGIGIVQSLVLYYSTKGWYPKTDGVPLAGVADALPLIVIIVTLIVRGKKLPTRGDGDTFSFPFAPRPQRVLPSMATFAAVTVLALLLFGPEGRLAVTNSLIAAAVCLSFVLLTGFVGQVSLAQMTLAGIAGFSLSKLGGDLGIPFPIAPLLAAAISAAVGVALALPALRVRGVHLAILTLSTAVVVEKLVFGNPGWSGGSDGSPVKPPSFAGLSFGPNNSSFLGNGTIPDPAFGIFCLAIVVLLGLVVVNVRRSSTGRRMLAVRANEQAAAASGISIARTKITAFCVSAFVAGIAGTLSSYRYGAVAPQYFSVIASLTFLAFAYLGGISSVSGALIGGLLATNGVFATGLVNIGLPSEYIGLVGGIGLILTILLNPAGISGSLRDFANRFGSKTGPRVPAPAGAGGLGSGASGAGG